MPIKPKKSLRSRVQSFFDGSGKRKTKQKTKQFLFEDRAILLARLIELKYSAKKDRTWAASVRACLLESPLLTPLGESLSKAVEAENKAVEAGSSETQTIDVIDAAVKLLERHPIAAFGRDTEGLISELVDIAVQKSAPARLFRWGAPLLIVGILGGTTYGGIKLAGLEKSRQEAEKALIEAKAGAEGVITRFRQSLDQESKTKLGELTSLVEDAKIRARDAAKNEMDSLPAFFNVEKNRLIQNGNDGVTQVVRDIKTASETKINRDIGKLEEKIRLASGEADAPGKIEEFKKAVRDLNDQINETTRLAGEVRNLRVMLEKTSGATRLTAAQVLWILEIKDFIAIGAAIFSCLAFLISIYALRRRNV